MRANRCGVLAVGVLLAGITIGFASGPGGREATKPREVTLTGRLVDLHGFMTEVYASDDRAKCTEESLRAGVPAALETDEGLIVIGEGAKGPARTLAPLALKEVELKGKLYERQGVRYLDMVSAREVTVEEESDESGWGDADYEDQGE